MNNARKTGTIGTLAFVLFDPSLINDLNLIKSPNHIDIYLIYILIYYVTTITTSIKRKLNIRNSSVIAVFFWL